jgi:hypothetical protein
MSLAFASGFVRGAAPGLASTVERNETRTLRAKVSRAEESYLAEKDRIINLARDQDWDANKVDQHLDALTSRTLADPDLQKDELIFSQLQKSLGIRTRAARNGYRDKYEGRLESVKDAEEALEMHRSMSAIAESARTSGVAGEFSGGFVTDPYSVTPEELLAQTSDYLAGAMEGLAKDKSLEGRTKYAKRMLAAEKTIKTIHGTYKKEYNKYQSDRLDELIENSFSVRAERTENSIREAMTAMGLPVPQDDVEARAAMDPQSIVEALDYENMSALATQAHKTYFDIADETQLEKVLGSMLAMRFLKETTAEEASTDSVEWKSWAQAIENITDDASLNGIFSNIFGDDTAVFVKANSSEIMSAARAAVNVQRPTTAILQQAYNVRQQTGDENTSALTDSLAASSLFGPEAQMFQATINAAFSPDVDFGDDGSLPWYEVLKRQIANHEAKEFFGNTKQFGDASIQNTQTRDNIRKIQDYIGERIERTRRVIQFPGYVGNALAKVTDKADKDIILADAVRQIDKNNGAGFSDSNNYFVEGGKLSPTALDATTKFGRTRGFVPPAYIDFVRNSLERLQMQDQAQGQFRGQTQAIADRAELEPIMRNLGRFLNTSSYRNLPKHQAEALNGLHKNYLDIRNFANNERRTPIVGVGELR